MARRAKNHLHVVAMASEEEKLTRRNPLGFPIVSPGFDFGSFHKYFQFHISIRLGSKRNQCTVSISRP
ncbi:unnamed protein product, partial [Arabis nemorensis]